MSGIRRIAVATLAGLLSEFVLRLISFVKLVQTGDQKCAESDYKMILESDHPLILTFRKDLQRVGKLQARLDEQQLQLADAGLKRLVFSFDDFKMNLEAIDLRDRGSAWNFFDSGLDIFLKELEGIVRENETVRYIVLSYGKMDMPSWRPTLSRERVQSESI